MNTEEKTKYIEGKWYKDKDGDFIKFKQFDKDGNLDYTAKVTNKTYVESNGGWFSRVFPECIPMTIDEMKQFLPKRIWWDENSKELFPMY